MYYLNVKQRLKLVQELVSFFSGGLLALEGELSKHTHELTAIPGASTMETQALKRQTVGPDHYDFFVLPLQPNTEQIIRRSILPRIGVTSNVYHVQIEREGELVFAAYDNFGTKQVLISSQVPEQWLQSLIQERILRGYQARDIQP